MSTATKAEPTKKKKQSTHSPLTKRGKRDSKLVKIMLKNPDKPLNEAMIEAGFSKTTANHQAKRTVERSCIQTPMQEALKKAGISEKHLAHKIKKGMDCQKIISATVIHKDNGGKTTQINDFIEVDDNPSQHKYIDTALKLKQSYPDPKVDVEHTGSVDLVVNVIDYSKVKIEGDK